MTNESFIVAGIRFSDKASALAYCQSLLYSGRFGKVTNPEDHDFVAALFYACDENVAELGGMPVDYYFRDNLPAEDGVGQKFAFYACLQDGRILEVNFKKAIAALAG